MAFGFIKKVFSFGKKEVEAAVRPKTRRCRRSNSAHSSAATR